MNDFPEATLTQAIATGDVLTTGNLLAAVQELRRLTIHNAHRIPKFRQIANALGGIETYIIEDQVRPDDERQGALPLDKPEPVEAELGRRNGRRGRA